MRASIIPVLLATAGCTTVLGPSINQSADAIRAYQGKNVDQIVAALGHPDHEEQVMGKMTYRWGTDHNDGPVCIWKAVTDNSGSVVDTSVYGNPMGCADATSRLQARSGN